jgi:hypothetical protein
VDFPLPHCRWTRESLDRSWGRRYGLTISTPGTGSQGEICDLRPDQSVAWRDHQETPPSCSVDQCWIRNYCANCLGSQEKAKQTLPVVSRTGTAQLRPFCHCSSARGQSKQTHAFLKIQGSHRIRQKPRAPLTKLWQALGLRL